MSTTFHIPSKPLRKWNYPCLNGSFPKTCSQPSLKSYEALPPKGKVPSGRSSWRAMTISTKASGDVHFSRPRALKMRGSMVGQSHEILLLGGVVSLVQTHKNSKSKQKEPMAHHACQGPETALGKHSCFRGGWSPEPGRPRLNWAADCWPLSLLGRSGRCFCNNPGLHRKPYALPANQISRGRQIDAIPGLLSRSPHQKEASVEAQSDGCGVDQL